MNTTPEIHSVYVWEELYENFCRDSLAMAAATLRITVVPAHQLDPDMKAAVHALCNRAYGEDVTPLFATFADATHVLGFWEGTLVSHAMWVTRWLQPGPGQSLRTAYVEMVATAPEWERRGFASLIMRTLADAVKEHEEEYELAALCPATASLYGRLGWRFWQGPLFIRPMDNSTGADLLPTPEESVMFLTLSQTPPLDVTLPLSAEWRLGELW